MTTAAPLDAAYNAVRAHLHGPVTDRTADELRGLLYIIAEAVERLDGHLTNGMALRYLGNDITGVEMGSIERHMHELAGRIAPPAVTA
ncbi:hypothetical protein [Nocardioides massiliensis]|uniref:Uncharacterized protein n=1 Tax=Nocardioides massiliensis TaxID=1325935 RepID=A0ABT9NJ95_9ACTN|nr:hypothetical protein [Nocardioides massiliensis]MDP9820426.1 hypothetical protein [Nocardioides massiliensis]